MLAALILVALSAASFALEPASVGHAQVALGPLALAGIATGGSLLSTALGDAMDSSEEAQAAALQEQMKTARQQRRQAGRLFDLSFPIRREAVRQMLMPELRKGQLPTPDVSGLRMDSNPFRSNFNFDVQDRPMAPEPPTDTVGEPFSPFPIDDLLDEVTRGAGGGSPGGERGSPVAPTTPAPGEGGRDRPPNDALYGGRRNPSEGGSPVSPTRPDTRARSVADPRLMEGVRRRLEQTLGQVGRRV